MRRKKLTTASHTYEPTSNKNIFRFVDREGNWTHYWIRNKKIFVPSVNHIIRAGYPKGERFYQYLLYANPVEAERRLRTSGEQGARTHAAIRDLIEGKRITLTTKYYNEITERFDPLNTEEWQNLEAFMNWVSTYRPQLLYQEIAVWSEDFHFAGTIDFIGTILVPEGDKNFPTELWGSRILILIDWKTGSGIWDEYELQVAAYRKALIEFMPRIFTQTSYTTLWTGIVRLGTSHRTGFEMAVWSPDESEANFALFASAYAIFVRKHGVDFSIEEKEIPSQFQVYIPQVEHIDLVPERPRRGRKKLSESKEVDKKDEK